MVNSTCSHQSCTVNAPRSEFENMFCPCHGAEYSRDDASVVWFPDEKIGKPLTRYKYSFDSTTQTLQIDLSQTI